MTRDFRKLRVFIEADRLVLAVYALSATLPAAERYGLQAQLRRAAVSVACNIVEGSARPTTLDYMRFLHVARASARECAYLLDLSHRLGFADRTAAVRAVAEYEGLQAGLLAQARAIDWEDGRFGGVKA